MWEVIASLVCLFVCGGVVLVWFFFFNRERMKHLA